MVNASFDQSTLLIGLGAPHSGSDWMVDYLSNHPDVLVPSMVAFHYFGATDKRNAKYAERLAAAQQWNEEHAGAARKDELAVLSDRVRMIEDKGAYLDFFRKRWEGEKIYCDITTSYYMLDREAFFRMRAANARVKFLLLMRNPIDRIWSQLCADQTSNPSFDPAKRLDHLLGRASALWQRNYIGALRNLDAVAGAEASHVIFSEELFAAETIEKLCDFLEVARRIAESPPTGWPDSAPLDLDRRAAVYRHLKPVYDFVHDRFEGAIPPTWLSDMKQFGSQTATSPAASAVPRRQLVSRAAAAPLIFDRLTVEWGELAPRWKRTPPVALLKSSPLRTFPAAGGLADRDLSDIAADDHGLTFPDWGQWRIWGAFGVAKLLLLKPGESKEDQALALLSFVAVNCWHSANDCYLTFDPSDPARFRSSEIFDKFFSSDQPLGLHCGHIAKFLGIILGTQGFGSRLARFKGSRRQGHIVTEAWLSDEERWLFLDADFGVAVRHRGKFIDAATLQELKQAGRADEIEVVDLAGKPTTGPIKFNMGFVGQVSWTPALMGRSKRSVKFREKFLHADHTALISEAIECD